MRNTRNIAIELEHMLRKEFGFPDRPIGTIFDADAIESRMFYDDMILLLHKNGKKDSTDFQDKIYEYRGVNMNQIPNYESMFEEFKTYL